MDFSWITLFLQDDTGGLEVRTGGGEWLDVNVGKILEFASRGRYRAMPDRVVNRWSKRSRVPSIFSESRTCEHCGMGSGESVGGPWGGLRPYPPRVSGNAARRFCVWPTDGGDGRAGTFGAVRASVVEHNHRRPNPTIANCKRPLKTNHLRLAPDLHMEG